MRMYSAKSIYAKGNRAQRRESEMKDKETKRCSHRQKTLAV